MQELEKDPHYLQRLVERVSLQDFGKPFLHKAIFNSRLRATGGRYHLRSHNLDFNPRQLERYGEEEFIKIIRHELCHYHLHLAGKGYQHRDADFKELLQQVGGQRYCKPIERSRPKRAASYLLKCNVCDMRYPRKKRMDPKRYRCGKCNGTLSLISFSSEKRV